MSMLPQILKQWIVSISVVAASWSPSSSSNGPLSQALSQTKNEASLILSQASQLPPNEQGFHPSGLHTLTQSYYGPDGFDSDGYDQDHYSREGYHLFTKRNRQGLYHEQIISKPMQEISPEDLRESILSVLHQRGKDALLTPQYQYYLVLDDESSSVEEKPSHVTSQEGAATTPALCQMCQENLGEGDLHCAEAACTHGVHRGDCLVQLLLYHLNSIGHKHPVRCDESAKGHELKIRPEDIHLALENFKAPKGKALSLKNLVKRWEKTTLEAYFLKLGGILKGQSRFAHSAEPSLSQEDQTLEDSLNDPKSDLRRCPYCLARTHRTEACFHMTCQNCKSEWNWKYGRLAVRSEQDPTVSGVVTFTHSNVDQDARVYRTRGDADYIENQDLECGYRKPSPENDYQGVFTGPVIRKYKPHPDSPLQEDSTYSTEVNQGYLDP